jgi:hypothetical protein
MSTCGESKPTEEVISIDAPVPDDGISPEQRIDSMTDILNAAQVIKATREAMKSAEAE